MIASSAPREKCAANVTSKTLKKKKYQEKWFEMLLLMINGLILKLYLEYLISIVGVTKM